jgi:hypothetical protein
MDGSLDNTAASNDVDYFTFQVGAENKITLTLSGDAVTNGAIVQLLDADGNVLATGTTTPVPANADAIAQQTLSYYSAAGGAFYVRVGSAANATQPASGAYTLMVNALYDIYEEHEPNDTLAQANPIAAQPMLYPMLAGDALPPFYYYPWYLDMQSGYITGSLDNSAAGNDVDYFSFPIQVDRKITLSFYGDAADSGAQMQLLDGDGNVLASAQGNSSLTYYFHSGGTTLYVRIATPDGAAQPASGAYRLSYVAVADPFEEHEPNDTFATANPISYTYPLAALNVPFVGPTAQIAFPLPIDSSPDGFITGELAQHADGSADVDYFSFTAAANRDLHIALSGNLLSAGGRITLYDANQNQLATDPAAIDWTTVDGGTFYVRVDQATPTAGADATTTQYRLDVTSKLHALPYQGPDETEPNDSMAQANTLTLQTTVANDDGSGVAMRSGAALGICGGSTNDVDFFQFNIQAGEHVQVGVDGFVCDGGGNVFASIADWIKADHISTSNFASLADVLKAHPDVTAGALHLRVFDSQGNVVGDTSDSGSGPGGVTFDATADGTYYAEISTTSTSLVNYRLSVLTSTSDSAPSPTGPIVFPAQGVFTPFVKVLHARQSFDFTDAAGKHVHVSYQGQIQSAGRGAKPIDPSSVTITFTNGKANGSDIASIVVNNASGGSLNITSGGVVHIASLTVHGLKQKNHIVGTLGQIHIAGNLGSLTSDSNIGTVVINGTLGSVSAPGEKIGTLNAGTFDSALAHASIVLMHIQNDQNAAALKLLAEGFSQKNKSMP